MPDADDEDRISHRAISWGLRSFVVHVSSEFSHERLGFCGGVKNRLLAIPSEFWDVFALGAWGLKQFEPFCLNLG